MVRIIINEQVNDFKLMLYIAIDNSKIQKK
jgi:hypothetical protein